MRENNRAARMPHIAAVVLLVSALIVEGSAGAAGDEAPIQPGAFIAIFPEDDEGCPDARVCGATLNFVFADADGRLYIGAAGHSIAAMGGVGAEIRLYEDGSRVGDAVFLHYVPPPPGVDTNVDNDFALVAIDADRYPDVSPMVRRWGGPTGIAEPGGTATGDLVAFYGHWAGLRETGLRGRQGVLTLHEAGRWGAVLPTFAQDSGSPVIHAQTGQAMGMLTQFFTDGALAVGAGPTVEHMVELAAGGGFDLELVTAPLRDPGFARTAESVIEDIQNADQEVADTYNGTVAPVAKEIQDAGEEAYEQALETYDETVAPIAEEAFDTYDETAQTVDETVQSVEETVYPVVGDAYQMAWDTYYGARREINETRDEVEKEVDEQVYPVISEPGSSLREELDQLPGGRGIPVCGDGICHHGIELIGGPAGGGGGFPNGVCVTLCPLDCPVYPVFPCGGL